LIERDFRALPGRGQRVAFDVRGRHIAGVQLGLAGEHQHDNAAIAAAALDALAQRGLPVPVAALRKGFAQARWPARLERRAGANNEPDLLFDAAHNPDGCAALARYLAEEQLRPRVLIFGVMADKDYPRMLALLAPHVEQVFYLQPKIARAATAEQLQACLPGGATRAAADALRRAKSAAGSGGLVICAGSIFAVAELRARALRLPSDPLIRM
jgi:dihydrofolate synthase/folylpolyglutamate synthase